MFEASIAPSALPAPTSVCSSSMNRMMPSAPEVTSCNTALRRSSNSPRYLEPASNEPRSSARSFLFFRLSGTSPLTMRCARPSTIAVLPTPGSPISTGLFFVRRDRTWIVRRISSSRPMTGSSLPSRAASVRSRVYFFSASYPSSAEALSALRPLRTSSIARLRLCASTRAAARAFAAPVPAAAARASKSRSTVTKLSPARCANCSACSKIRASSGDM